MTKKFIVFALTFFPFILSAQQKDNPELAKMYKDDQTARQVTNIDWMSLMKQDSARRVRVYQLIEEGKVLTAKDYYHSAMIFQHGGDTDASRMAVEHMKKAIALDSSMNKWLLAAAIDRDLMRRGEPQIYGTQFVKWNQEGKDGKWERYKLDSTIISDEERKRYGVETLAEQRIKLRNMNLLPVSSLNTESIDNTILKIKTEHKKGAKSQYNTSENGLNDFGYDLMHANKYEDALSIFKLNIELYPNAFNTYDSYGECLLKMNRKEEALTAYKKSLELNPKDDNAKDILSQNGM